MSLLRWFSPKKKAPAYVPSELPSSGLSRLESTKPFNALRQGAHGGGAQAQPANRKHERMMRRELLYAVVRESMVRAGVLSSSYKFKVLSLDPRGQQFLVMVDLSQSRGTEVQRLAEIEAMIAQSAKARYEILVTAVYWRANDHVAVGDPADRRGATSRPAPLMREPRASAPAPLTPAVPAAPVEAAASRPAELRAAPPAARYEPLQEDEVAAFKKALAAGVRGEQALAQVNAGKEERNYAMLTGFEDTEMAEGGEGPAEHLGPTQYGALR
jgi:hypothetical protein